MPRGIPKSGVNRGWLKPGNQHALGNEYSLVHGHSRRGGWSSTYVSWAHMKSRCSNPNIAQYARYGGRGISVKYPSFEAFLADVGERPDGTTINRIDNDGDYEPGNCRWATSREQAGNRKPPTRGGDF